MRTRFFLVAGTLLILIASQSTAAQFISSDTYTRYELLAPESHQFKIYYEVTETRPGARFHFNAIREGSEASDESVIDLATGKPLKFEVVTGAQAQAAIASDKNPENGPRFTPTAKYIQVHLDHPVPARGEYRVAIIKTYKDDKSYYTEGDSIVFKRPLGIPRNSVVLPVGFEVVSCSVATQLLTEADGRLKLSFVNPGSGGQLEVAIKARRSSQVKKPDVSAFNRGRSVSIASGLAISVVSGLPAGGAQAQAPPTSERAYQDREILYELQAPESHAFRITHDYTARKTGEQYYFNVVRAGSHVTEPESIDLDSGEMLKWEVISGKQAKERKLPVEQVGDDSEIVVTHLRSALASGTTNRLRLKETYTDAKSYYLDGDELVWDRTFGRLRNTVVLPPGWYLTALSSPATIQTLADGRVSVYIVNPRNDEVRVYLRARLRSGDVKQKQ